MDEKKLKGFVSIYENKSMTRAAEKLYTTPPALMRQLDALEADLGIRLFSRSPHGCKPTKAGELLYEKSISILNIMQDIRSQLSSLNKTENMVSICVNTTGCLPLIDLYCESLVQQYPGTDIQYISDYHMNWIDLVKIGKADCCLLTNMMISKIEQEGLSYSEIGERQIICMMSVNHPLSAKKTLTIDDLKKENIQIDIPTYKTLEKCIEALNLQIQVLQHECAPSEVINHCRKKGVRITASPYGEQFSSLVSIPVTDLPPMRCGWVTRKKQSDMVKELIRISREQNDLI